MKNYSLTRACGVLAGHLGDLRNRGLRGREVHGHTGPRGLEVRGDTVPTFPNTQIVILEGDAGKRGPVTLRFRCPADYKFLPHTHPGPERVTVLTGTMLIGIGPKYDAATLTQVQTGGFFLIPTKAPHYGECKGETIIEVHTTGPLGTTYVNPADDPSHK